MGRITLDGSKPSSLSGKFKACPTCEGSGIAINTYEPSGIRFFDAANNREMLLVQDEKAPFNGWLCFRHPDGQWVTLREATQNDLDTTGCTAEGGRHGR